MRTRVMPLPDWTSQSVNTRQHRVIRYPGIPTGPIIDDDTWKDTWTQTNPALRGRKVTSDENHGISVRKSLLDGKFTGDIGGNFSSMNFATTVMFGHEQHVRASGVSGSNYISNDYWGPVFAVNPRTQTIPVDALMKNLGPLGTTAIARCKPTNNVADLSNALSEIIFEGLPKILGATLWKGKSNLAKIAGGEFLNLEFGWKPLVRDIRSISYAVANADRLITAYERNSGKIVRRRYEFPVEETEVTQIVGPSDGYWFSHTDVLLLDTSKPQPVLYKTTKTFRRCWFSGAFTYHLPTGYKSRNGIVAASAKAKHLLGLDLTPEIVWNATPWSWAVDWFSNTGDVISNLSSWKSDGLVLKWGYMMEHTVTSITYTLVGTCRLKPYGTIQASPVTVRLENKRRVKATPFGFESSWSTMTPRQLAISAALGIKRVF